MGCRASTQASAVSGPNIATVSHAAVEEDPSGPRVSATVAHAPPEKPSLTVSITTEEAHVEAMGATESDSPTFVRVTDKKRQGLPGGHDAGIPTILSGVFDEDDLKLASFKDKTGRGSSQAKEKLQPAIPPFHAEDPALPHDSPALGSGQLGSGKMLKGAVLILDGHSDRLNDNTFSSLAPPSMRSSNNGNMPAVALRPVNAAVAPAQGRYDDMDLSLSDDEDDGHGFDLHRWRRYYEWNKNKHADLLEFLWRRFDSKHHSIYCATFKAQDNLYAGFQGDNVVHGFCCRLEASGLELFASMQTLSNSAGAYKVLGALIFNGPNVPAGLQSMPDYNHFQLLKADTKDPLVRQFVGNLITGCSPLPGFDVVCSQVVSIAGK